jgi:hypothetical protein
MLPDLFGKSGQQIWFYEGVIPVRVKVAFDLQKFAD